MTHLNLLFGIIYVFTGATVGVLCIPLIKGDVRRNHYYGFRFKRSYESEENWYAVNRYGATQMAYLSVLLTAFGLLLFFVPVRYGTPFFWLTLAAPMVLLLPGLQAYKFSRRLPVVKNSGDLSEGA